MSDPAAHVIVVDDDAAVRDSLKFLLELEGLHVRVYESGALLLADADLPARGCLVIDYRMPGMDGFALLQKLRDRQVDFPAILVTARATDELQDRIAASGFKAVVQKPFHDSRLVDSIRNVLAVPLEEGRSVPKHARGESGSGRGSV